MKKITLILPVILVLFLAAACKEKRVERRMEGKWVIAKQTSSYGFGFGSGFGYSGISNPGTMEFSDNGNVIWTQTPNDTTIYVRTGTWTNSIDQLTLSLSQDDNFEAQVIPFTIKKQTRKEMRLLVVLDYIDDSGYQVVDQVTLEMDKE